MRIELSNESTQTVFNTYEYERGLGQSNPVWEPVPDHVYPLSCAEIVYYIIYVIAIIAIGLGIMIGFLFWAVKDLSKYVLIWSIVFVVSFAIVLILVYFGGKDRRRQEKELIAETNRRQEEMTRGGKKSF